MIFGTAKDIVSIFYRTKNQGHGLRVGGDMAILFFCPIALLRLQRANKTEIPLSLRPICNHIKDVIFAEEQNDDDRLEWLINTDQYEDALAFYNRSRVKKKL